MRVLSRTVEGRLSAVGFGLVALMACSSTEPGEELIATRVTQLKEPSRLVPILDIGLRAAGNIANDGPQGTSSCNQSLGATTDGSNYSFKLQLQGSSCLAAYAGDKPYISSRYYLAPGDTTAGLRKSLQLTLPPRPGSGPFGACFGGTGCAAQSGPDSAELVVHDGISDPSSEARYGVGFNSENPKYFGFAMQIDSASGPITGSVSFMRVVQSGTCGGALVAYLSGSAAVGFKFSLVAGDDGGSRQILAPTALTTGAWNRFVFFLSPHSQETVATDVEGSGTVMLWLDGNLILDWRGLAPGPLGDFGCKPRFLFSYDNWNLNVGPYRKGTGIFPDRLYLFFDNIRVTPRKDQADPITRYPWW